MKNTIALGIVLLLWGSAAAAEKGASIMFGDEAPSFKPQNDSSAQSERCQELLREVDNLKGKPQRRITAQERYEAECLLSGAADGG